jgi:hypothetical protein
MGYNTAAIILNDGLDQFSKDPNTGLHIRNGVMQAHRKKQTIPLGNHCNPMTVLPPCHADETQVIIIHGNCIRRAARMYGPVEYRSEPGGVLYDDDSDELGVALLKRLAHHLGYSMRKIR